MLDSSLSKCAPGTFETSHLSVFGADILSIDASPVRNITRTVPSGFRFIQPSVDAVNLSFCNVTVTYTHPGTDDRIHVETWLPTASHWNERLYSVGGGGYAAGRFELPYSSMVGALAEGYAASTTDAGLGINTDSQDASSWILLSPGNVDLHKVQDFGSVSLNDQAIISKEIINIFYKKRPIYSYFNGCSQGGRQGLMLAQRFPKSYDGIAAGAPAINLPKIAASIFWPQQKMNMMGEYPYACEIDAITQAATAICDKLDGIVDGVVADVDGCLARVDPLSFVGKVTNCSQTGALLSITAAAATVASATWKANETRHGEKISYGFAPSADLTGTRSYIAGIAATDCSSSSDGCVGQPVLLGSQWFQLFVAKDPTFNVGNLTYDEYSSLVRAGVQEYDYLFSTNDADLSRFRDAGGKMLTFHGLDDNIIPYKVMREYYEDVMSQVSDTQSFYRYFEVPGLSHCFGGSGGQPIGMFEQLRAWVENGTVPESSPIGFTDSTGTDWSRILCPFPQRARFQAECGDATVAECWVCEE